MKIRVAGYGSLFRWFTSGESGETMTLADQATIHDLLQKAGIPEEEIWMATVNGHKASLDQVLCEGDELRLFSPLGGG